MTLVQALEGVELTPGSVYACRVRGLLVEVRVDATPLRSVARTTVDDQLPIEPWCELPAPDRLAVMVARLAPLPPPDHGPILGQGDVPE